MGGRMMYVLADKLLGDYLQCASKSYLRLQGQPGEIHDFAALCSRFEARHRASAIERLASSQTTTNDVRNFGGSPVQDALAWGYQLILDAVGAANGLETHFDGLERCPGKSHLGTYCYRPIRSCRYQKPSSAFYLLLAFDALILRDLQGTLPSDGILICGPSFKRTHVLLGKYLESLLAVLSRLRLQSASAPPLALNRHCELCEFRRTCHDKAVETDNLTLLRGMTPKEVHDTIPKVSSLSLNYHIPFD
jgi:predicted RecB family nuclease